MGLERKDSVLSTVAVSILEGEDEDIKVVQVGEKAREWNQDPKYS